MEIRKLTEAEVEFMIEIEDEDIEMDFDSGEPEKDEELKEKLRARLARGDLWAWCCVKVTAKWGDWKGVDYLGGCSYENEADFRQDDGHFGSMKSEALDDLNEKIAAAFASLKDLVKAA